MPPCFPWVPSADAVAGASHRFDDRRVAELLAKRHDRDADGVRKGIGELVPRSIEELLCAQDMTVREEQLLEHCELLGREAERAPVSGDLPLPGIDVDPVASEHAGRRRCSTGERADTRDELLERERFAEVVVGTEREPFNEVLRASRRGAYPDPCRILLPGDKF